MFFSSSQQKRSTVSTTFSTKSMNTEVMDQDDTSEPSKSSWLSYLWSYLMHQLLRGHEPRVWRKRNAVGEVFYYGYDPRTGRLIQCSTEADMRNWLDRLPYC